MHLLPLRAHTLFPLLGVILAAASGCMGAGEDDDIDSIEQEKRIDPKGTEKHTTGTVIVKVPAGSPSLVETRVQFRKAGAPGSSPVANGLLDTPHTLPLGTYDLRIEGSNEATVFATFEVKGGQTTTITLPVLAPVPVTATPRPADAVPVKFTWGPTFQPRSAAPIQRHPTIRLVGNGSVYASPIGTATGVVLVPNATYEVHRSGVVLHTLTVGATPQVYTLAPVADDWVSRPVTVPSSSLSIAIDASDFPLARAVDLTWDCATSDNVQGNFRSTAESSRVTLRRANVASTAQTFTGDVGTPACTYKLSLVSGDLPIDTSKPQVNLAVHYIDVSDVHLTHEDGTARDVRGKYRLLRVPGPGQAAVVLTGFNYSTNTAIPVAPGTYRVEVQYNDNAGPKSYFEEITIP